MPQVPTPSQTVGPFFHLGFAWLFQPDLAHSAAGSERVSVTGRVLDGDGQPVPDAAIEIWQPDARSGRTGSGFGGFARVPTDAAGAFRFATVKPALMPGPGGRPQAPHLVAVVFMRGLLKQLITRMYFPDEPGNAHDPVLTLVEPARRRTLVARGRGGEPMSLEWNLVLQGPDETVFFDF